LALEEELIITVIAIHNQEYLQQAHAQYDSLPDVEL